MQLSRAKLSAVAENPKARRAVAALALLPVCAFYAFVVGNIAQIAGYFSAWFVNYQSSSTDEEIYFIAVAGCVLGALGGACAVFWLAIRQPASADAGSGSGGEYHGDADAPPASGGEDGADPVIRSGYGYHDSGGEAAEAVTQPGAGFDRRSGLSRLLKMAMKTAAGLGFFGAIIWQGFIMASERSLILSEEISLRSFFNALALMTVSGIVLVLPIYDRVGVPGVSDSGPGPASAAAPAALTGAD